MSEYPENQEQLRNPTPSGQAQNDDNLRGDVGDQGNDLRFAEEEQLIREQAAKPSANTDVPATDQGTYAAAEGEYTDADGAKDAPSRDADEDKGGYTDSEGTGR